MLHGRRILVDALPKADPKAVRLSILGPAFSQLLAQRGHLVLHASAVLIRGQAVAFLGTSGAGKSTISASFYKRGYKLVTDNLLLICFKKDKVFVVPTFPQFKLWPDTAKKLGWDPATLEWINAVTKKRSLLLKNRFVKKPVSLKAIYILHQGRSIKIEEAASAQKLFTLIKESFGAHSVGQKDALPPHLLNCARLIRQVPIRILTRNSRLSSLSELMRAVEEDLSKL